MRQRRERVCVPPQLGPVYLESAGWVSDGVGQLNPLAFLVTLRGAVLDRISGRCLQSGVYFGGLSLCVCVPLPIEALLSEDWSGSLTFQEAPG